jgi:hypothetical protein
VHNLGTAKKLESQAEETYKGQRLNELCDHYHAKFRSSSGLFGTVKRWPRPEFEFNDNLLSDFLASQENSTAKIEEFKTALLPPLVYTSIYPASEGMEVRKSPPKQVAFLVDYSGSMSRKPDTTGSTLMQQAIENVLSVYSHFIVNGDSVSLTLFDHEYNEIFPMALRSPEMYDLIKNAPTPKRGGTSFYDSLIKVIQTLHGSGDNVWIIALTDGEDQHSKKSLRDCINAVKSSKINLFLIGFMVNAKLASVLSSITKVIPNERVGKYITAGDKAALDAAFLDLASLFEGPVMLT